MRKLVFFLFCVISMISHAQNNMLNHWYYHNKRHLDFTAPTLTVDSNCKFNLARSERNFGFMASYYGGSTNQLDINGNLLFYTDGWTGTYDRLHRKMPNWEWISVMGLNYQVLTIPQPKNPNRFFVFSSRYEFDTIAPAAYGGGFFDTRCPRGALDYFVVNLSLNGGYGAIESSEKQTNYQRLNPDSSYTTTYRFSMTATKHANGTDYWLVAGAGIRNWMDSAVFIKCILIDSSGVQNPTITRIPNKLYIGGYYLTFRFNYSGNVIAMLWNTSVAFFSFNKSTGAVSFIDTVNLPRTNPRVAPVTYGLAFSPNDSLVYIGNLYTSEVFQIEYLNPRSSRRITILNTAPDKYSRVSGEQGTGSLQLGKDGRIYGANIYSTAIAGRISDTLFAINNPNVFGPGCGIDTFALIYPNVGYYPYGLHGGWGLPHYLDANLVPGRYKGCTPFTVRMTPPDTTAASVLWKLPDGSTQTGQSITYTFSVPGQHSIPIVYTRANGTKDSSYFLVEAYASPSFYYKFRADTVCLGGTTHFQVDTNGYLNMHPLAADSATGVAIPYDSIYYGHITYATPGRHAIRITAYNHITGCADTVFYPVWVPWPSSRKSFSDTAGCVPFTISLRDSSLADSIVVRWGDGSRQTLVRSTVTNLATHSYTGVGRTWLTRTLYLNGCAWTDSQLIGVFDIPHAAFTLVDSGVCGAIVLKLINQSTGADSIRVNWGDGTTQTLAGGNGLTHTHLYNTNGPVQVSLTALRTWPNRLLCNDFTSINHLISIRPLPQIAFSLSDSIVCIGSSITLQNMSNYIDSARVLLTDGRVFTLSGSSVTIPFNAAGQVMITLVGYSREGCTDSAKQRITVLPLAAPVLTPQNTQGCAPFTLLINNSAVGDSLSIDWGDGNSSSFRIPDPNARQHIYTSIGTFTVTATAWWQLGSRAACSAVQRFTITTTGMDTTTNVRVLYTTLENGSLKTEWNPVNGAAVYRIEKKTSTTPWYNVAIQPSTKYVDVLAKPTERAFYRVAATDSCNGSSRYSNVGSNIVLTGEKISTEVAILYWNPYEEFTDGVRSYELMRTDSAGNNLRTFSPTDTTYRDDQFWDDSLGYRCYTLVATSTDGYRSTSNTVCLSNPSTLFIPTAFSPNGDGLNEQWVIVTSGIVEMHVEIYNRWGERIFMSDGPRCAWDGGGGVTGGSPPTAAVYMIRARGRDGQLFERKGVVSVVR